MQDPFHHVFKQFGLPKAIKSDNGTPFASTGIARLSRLFTNTFVRYREKAVRAHDKLGFDLPGIDSFGERILAAPAAFPTVVREARILPVFIKFVHINSLSVGTNIPRNAVQSFHVNQIGSLHEFGPTNRPGKQSQSCSRIQCSSHRCEHLVRDGARGVSGR